ncbi:helix-turn-helix domain-containing protein [Actinosynnema sp. NPDC020468]|uniref:AraC family transcriptional regulator n=1 Tax=Actinosynnema sp. NPDC020468 TaxID=3154488 RepID=UPI0033E00318
MPNITPLLFIGFGVPLRILSATGPPRSASSILQMAPAGGCLTGHGGWEHGIQVDLTPTGAYQLTGIPMHEVTGRCLALEEVWGAWAHWLESGLGALPDWPSRFAFLTTALETRMRSGPVPSPRVVLAAARLQHPSGAVVGDLAAELDWSRQHLTEMAVRQIGHTPRTVIRLARFQRAGKMLSEPAGVSFAHIATLCGYSDQAHFSRDFRTFAGRTPVRVPADQFPYRNCVRLPSR